MERLAVALCASLVLMQGCALFEAQRREPNTAQPALASKPAFVDGITLARDPTTHRASLRLQLSVSGRRVLLTSNPERRPERFELSMQRHSAMPLYQQCRRVDMVIDTYTRTIAGNAAFARGGRQGIDAWEALTAPVTRATLTELSAGEVVELRACQDRLVLDATDRTWLGLYLRRWSEIAASAPAPVVPVSADPAVAAVEPAPAAHAAQPVPTPAPPAPTSAPTVPAPSSTPSAPIIGCGYDTQCKGDRICVAGSCVDPPAKAGAK